MAIKSDAQGFLVGEIIKTNDQLLTAQQDTVAVLSRIRGDVAAITRAIKGQEKAQGRSTGSGQSGWRTPRVVVVPTGRSAAGRTVGGNRTEPGRASALSARRASASVAVSLGRDSKGRFLPAANAADQAKTADRDASGRFTAGLGRSGEPVGAATGGIMSRLSDNVGRLAGSLNAADNLDPTVNAVKEVADVVSPLGRGLGSMFGPNAERKKERWYMRVWTALKDGNKIAKDSKAVTGSGDRFNIGFGGGGPMGATGRLMRGAGGLLGGLFKGGKGLLRRVPVLGALLAGGGVLASLLGDDDPTKSTEENRIARYRGVGEASGMGVGAVAGGVLGSALGPLGALGGAWLGSLIGEKVGGAVGDWSKQLMDSDVPAQMMGAWTTTTAAIGAAWDSLAGDARSAWSEITTKASAWWDDTKTAAGTIAEQVGALAGGMNDWFKSKTGIDVKSGASNAWASVKGFASDAGSAVLDAARSVGGAMVPGTVKRAVAAGAAAVTQAKAGYDEARGNPTTALPAAGALQTGARVAGGAVGASVSKIIETGAGYNVVQQADGRVVRRDGARNWRNHNPGNIEAGKFATSMGAIGSDGRFAIFPSYEAGRAAKSKLIFDGKGYKDLSLTDAISRYAPPSENNTTAYQNSVLAAVGGTNKRMGDYTAAEREKIMNAMQQVEGFKAGRTTTIPVAMTATVARMPKVASVNVPAAVPMRLPEQAKNEVPEKLNSGAAAGGKTQVTLNDKTTQNIGDRGIAHIVTGGMGSA